MFHPKHELDASKREDSDGQSTSTEPQRSKLNGRGNETTLVSSKHAANTADDKGEGDTLEDSLAYKSLAKHRKQRRKKRNIRIAILVGTIAVVAAVLVANHLNQQEASSASDIETATVTREDFTKSVSATGNAEPVSSVIVSPEVEGTIDEVDVKEGDSVSAGDVLFTIKNDSLDTAVDDAALQVEKDKNAVSAAQTALNEANAASSATSGTDAASGNQTSGTTSVAQAQANLSSAQLTLQSDQSSYDKAVAMAAKRTVTAPSAGSIIEMNAVSGQAVGTTTGTSSSATTLSSSEDFIKIADLSQLIVTVQVNEVDIPQVSVGQSATVSFSALPDLSCDATVRSIATVASTNTSSTSDSGIVTYAVDLLISSPDSRIKPGMTASVQIVSQQVPNAFCVPNSAIQTDSSDSSYVMVVTGTDTNGQPVTERRAVTVTAQNSSTTAIEDGLSEGETVALNLTDTTQDSGSADKEG